MATRINIHQRSWGPYCYFSAFTSQSAGNARNTHDKVLSQGHRTSQKCSCLDLLTMKLIKEVLNTFGVHANPNIMSVVGHGSDSAVWLAAF